MSEPETLQAKAFISRNRVADLPAQLAAADRQLQELHERLSLSDEERAVLEGQGDGCIRVADLRPIVARVFGQPAKN